ncbi:MAG: hypothetical protein ACOCRX_04150 [Candidatus Woesearchaeota archaeon]
MSFWIGLGIGGLIGIFIVPLGIFVYAKIVETKIRRKIKRDIENKKFLKPLDKRDFDVEKWANNINLDELEGELKEFTDKIFRRGKYKPKKEDDKVYEITDTNNQKSEQEEKQEEVERNPIYEEVSKEETDYPEEDEKDKTIKGIFDNYEYGEIENKDDEDDNQEDYEDEEPEELKEFNEMNKELEESEEEEKQEDYENEEENEEKEKDEKESSNTNKLNDEEGEDDRKSEQAN